MTHIHPRLLLILALLAPIIQATEFNLDLLSTEEKQSIDFSKFESDNFILPGKYELSIYVNNVNTARMLNINIYESLISGTYVCIDNELVDLIGMKTTIKDAIIFDEQGCMNSELFDIHTDVSLVNDSLTVTIPKQNLEYSDSYWDPSERWVTGETGLIIDYNTNFSHRKSIDGTSKNSSAYGVAGLNFDRWRFRTEWQTSTRSNSGNSEHTGLVANRYYAYTDIKTLESRVTIGESTLTSKIFDNFLYQGINLTTNESMIPPHLRGYAPVISGFAQTNAKVIVTQNNRILYETTVPQGFFRIEDLDRQISGKLDIRIEEADGSVQEFTYNTSSIPYLTRPGTLRYNLTVGQPNDNQHNKIASGFLFGETSWGVNNGWSLYNGIIASDYYSNFAIGTGWDLDNLGAVSFDWSHSNSKYSFNQHSHAQGNSYKINYSKEFSDLSSQVTFAGYKFSDKNYMSMSDAISAKSKDIINKNEKETYVIVLSKQFDQSNLSTFIDYTKNSYWDNDSNERYSVSISGYTEMFDVKNINWSLIGYRTYSDINSENGYYLNISVPLGKARMSYHNSSYAGKMTHNASYSSRNNNDNYVVTLNKNRDINGISGYYTHDSTMAKVAINGSSYSDHSRTENINIQGGLTATKYGAVLHNNSVANSSRIFVTTPKSKDVHIDGNGISNPTNRKGNAIVSNINAYKRSSVSVDVDNLPDNTEILSNSVSTFTLTDGAIAYHKFDVLHGQKGMINIRLENGSYVPFSSVIENGEGQYMGMFTENGNAYVSGINFGEYAYVNLDNTNRCRIYLDENIFTEYSICRKVDNNHE